MKDLGLGQLFSRYSLYFALIVAWVAMLGSLYFSEVLGYVPCALCWYQRILMYPLAVIIAVGLVRMDSQLPYYILPFTLLGQGVATYHYLIQKTQIFGAPTACRSGIPCTSVWINWLGFITIPFLAMTAFFLITIFTLVALTAGQPEEDERQSAPLWQVAAIIIVIALIFGGMAQMRGQTPTLSLTEVAGGDQTPITQPIPITEADSSIAAAPNETVADDSAGNPANDPAEDPAVVATGQQLYAETCTVCHGPNAEGVANLGPSLLESEVLFDRDDAEALAFIRAGVSTTDPNNTTGLVMPPSGGRPDYSDEQILAVVAYLRSLTSAQ